MDGLFNPCCTGTRLPYYGCRYTIRIPVFDIRVLHNKKLIDSLICVVDAIAVATPLDLLLQSYYQ